MLNSSASSAERPQSSPVDIHRNYGFEEAARVIGVSRRTIIRLADNGDIRSVRILKRRLIPGSEVLRVRDQGTD